MGQEYNEDYIRFRHRSDFINKLFSAWDYHITNKDVALFKHKAMKIHFQVSWQSLKPMQQLTIQLLNDAHYRKKCFAVKKETRRELLRNG